MAPTDFADAPRSSRMPRAAVPPLPPSLADPRPVVALGTGAWVLAGALVLLTGASATWAWASAVGAALGGLGTVIMHRQRRAALRGDRGAQRGLV